VERGDRETEAKMKRPLGAEKFLERDCRDVSGDGYLDLLGAIVGQSIGDLLLKIPKRPNCSRGSKKERDWRKRCLELQGCRASAERYIFEKSADDAGNVFSFESIVKMMTTVSPNQAREAIRKMVARVARARTEAKRNKINKGETK
jgi:hypothetical protein